MAQAKMGDRVKINFTGKLEDGTIFDTTHEDGECASDDCGCEAGPMELTLGEEEFFAQVEEALVGMAPGEKKTLTIPAADALGEYDKEQVITVPRDQLPEGLDPKVGQELELTDPDDEDGEGIVVTVTEVNDESITLDANHPLAGEDLTFDLELVEIL